MLTACTRPPLTATLGAFQKSSKVHFEPKKSSKTKKPSPKWSPYGCFYPPDMTEFPQPRLDTLPKDPLGKGEQYYLDLSGNIRKVGGGAGDGGDAGAGAGAGAGADNGDGAGAGDSGRCAETGELTRPRRTAAGRLCCQRHSGDE